jgi:hypothetical protein
MRAEDCGDEVLAINRDDYVEWEVIDEARTVLC